MATTLYMPLYAADYMADTAHLTTVQHGAYMLLIMTYWQRAKPLPDDDGKLARIVRMPQDEWASIRPEIEEFFTVADGEWRHGRIDRELEKAMSKSNAARAAAQRRHGKPDADAMRTHSGRIADAVPTQSERNAVRLGKEETTQSACARDDGLKDVDLESLLTEAGGKALAWANPNILTMAEVRNWLEAGADLHRDVLPVVKAKCAVAADGSIRSWRYFAQAVADAKASRLAGLPPGNVGGRKPDKPQYTPGGVAINPRDHPEQWAAWVDHFDRAGSFAAQTMRQKAERERATAAWTVRTLWPEGEGEKGEAA